MPENNDSNYDPGEEIAGVVLSLTGLDDQGVAVTAPATTAVDGTYTFTNLRPSGVLGYTVTETQPTGINDYPTNTGTFVGTLASVAVGSSGVGANVISGVVLPIKAFTLDAAFKRGLRRSGLEDVRFHDLRRTAITRMAEKLPNVIELAAVSGHKSLMVLKRYYHPKAHDLAMKLG